MAETRFLSHVGLKNAKPTEIVFNPTGPYGAVPVGLVFATLRRGVRKPRGTRGVFPRLESPLIVTYGPYGKPRSPHSNFRRFAAVGGCKPYGRVPVRGNRQAIFGRGGWL